MHASENNLCQNILIQSRPSVLVGLTLITLEESLERPSVREYRAIRTRSDLTPIYAVS